jgi:hypothetical protein
MVRESMNETVGESMNEIVWESMNEDGSGGCAATGDEPRNFAEA